MVGGGREERQGLGPDAWLSDDSAIAFPSLPGQGMSLLRALLPPQGHEGLSQPVSVPSIRNPTVHSPPLCPGSTYKPLGHTTGRKQVLS